MESIERLPTGKLIPADQIKFEEFEFRLSKPNSLGKTKLDDVFYGMRPSAPTRIDFRDVKRSIEIKTSKEFTHLVVWTPGSEESPRPYFGVESQTCSTDAHNMFAAGFKEESHLQICPAGEVWSGWVEYHLHVE